MVEKYEAAMVLSGVGDALGYKNGEWEFNTDGKDIHRAVKTEGGRKGLNGICVSPPNWMVSDDTVMHIATAKALVQEQHGETKDALYRRIANEYKNCMEHMAGRAPGATCMFGTAKLCPDKENGYRIPFNPRGGGCGAAMRAMCIGLRYPFPEHINDWFV